MSGPNFTRATAYLRTGLVRIDLDTASKVVGFSCTLSPDVADKLADELRAASKIARIESTTEEHSASQKNAG